MDPRKLNIYELYSLVDQLLRPSAWLIEIRIYVAKLKLQKSIIF